jgi:hypothetical protein
MASVEANQILTTVSRNDDGVCYQTDTRQNKEQRCLDLNKRYKDHSIWLFILGGVILYPATRFLGSFLLKQKCTKWKCCC